MFAASLRNVPDGMCQALAIDCPPVRVRVLRPRKGRCKPARASCPHGPLRSLCRNMALARSSTAPPGSLRQDQSHPAQRGDRSQRQAQGHRLTQEQDAAERRDNRH